MSHELTSSLEWTLPTRSALKDASATMKEDDKFRMSVYAEEITNSPKSSTIIPRSPSGSQRMRITVTTPRVARASSPPARGVVASPGSRRPSSPVSTIRTRSPSPSAAAAAAAAGERADRAGARKSRAQAPIRKLRRTNLGIKLYIPPTSEKHETVNAHRMRNRSSFLYLQDGEYSNVHSSTSPCTDSDERFEVPRLLLAFSSDSTTATNRVRRHSFAVATDSDDVPDSADQTLVMVNDRLMRRSPRPTTTMQPAASPQDAPPVISPCVVLFFKQQFQETSLSSDADSPLHRAAELGLYDVVEFLLSTGQYSGSLESFTKEGHTPLGKALQNRHLKVVACLVEFDAKIPASIRLDPQVGRSLLTISLEAGMFNAYERLVACGIKPPPGLLESIKVIACANKRLVVFPAILNDERLALKRLDLSNNRLGYVPPSIARHTLVHLEGNPLGCLPESLRKAPWPEVRSFLQGVLTHAQQGSLQKILVLGDAGAERTKLVKALFRVREEPPENGMVIHQDVRVSKRPVGPVWEFGQRVLEKQLHQPFLASPSVFLLVFSVGADEVIDTVELDAWMQQIKYHNVQYSSRSFIIMVGLHSHDTISERRIEAIKARYSRDRYVGMVGLALVNTRNLTGLKELKAMLLAVYRRVEPINPDIVLFAELLASLPEPTLHVARFNALIDEFCLPVGDTHLVNFALRSSGVVSYFSEPKALKRTILLKPQWLVNKFWQVCEELRTGGSPEGMQDVSALGPLFLSADTALVEFVLALGKRFEVWFDACNRQMDVWFDAPVANDECLLVALCALPEIMPDLQTSWTEAEKNSEYERVYEFGITPVNIFYRLMTRVLGLPGVEGLSFWASGFLVRLKGFVGMVTVRPDINRQRTELKLKVRVIGNPRESLLLQDVPRTHQTNRSLFSLLVETMEMLIDCYYPTFESTISRLAPCIHCLRTSSMMQPYYFKIEDCIKAMSVGCPFVYCQNIKSAHRMVQVDRICPDLLFSDIKHLDNDKLRVGRPLGKGGFGLVYKGTLMDSLGMKTHVAIKQPIVVEGNTEKAVDKFRAIQEECYIMSWLDHPNLVKLFGVTLNPLRLVMEYVPCGDLWHFLRTRKADNTYDLVPDERFPWILRLKMALDIAKGMNHLQSISPPIVHRDLRSPNVFLQNLSLEAEVNAKVADFGLSRFAAPKIAGFLKTWQWLAPEVLSVGEYDERSDIYSYGIVLWEIASKNIPFLEYYDDPRYTRVIPAPNKDEPERVAVNEMGLKYAISYEDLRPTIDELWPDEVKTIIEHCLQTDPAQRPAFSMIMEILEEGLKKYQDHHSALSTQCRLPRLNNQTQLPTLLDVNSGSTLPPLDPSAPMGLQRPSEVPTQDFVAKFELGGRTRIFSMLFTSGKMWIGTSDGSVLVYDVAQYQLLHSFKAHTGRVYCLLEGTSEKTVWSCSEDGGIKVWGARIYEPLAEWAEEGMVKSLCAVDEIIWAAQPKTGVITMFDVSSNKKRESQTLQILYSKTGNKVVRRRKGLSEILGFRQAQSHPATVNCMAVHKEFVWVGTYRTLFILNKRTQKYQGSIEAHQGLINQIVSHNNSVWTCSDYGDICVWSDVDAQLIARLSSHGGKVCSMCAVRDTVWSGSSDLHILLWDTYSLEPFAELSGSEKKDVWKVLVPAGNYVWGGTLNGNVYVWDTRRFDAYDHHQQQEESRLTRMPSIKTKHLKSGADEPRKSSSLTAPSPSPSAAPYASQTPASEPVSAEPSPRSSSVSTPSKAAQLVKNQTLMGTSKKKLLKIVSTEEGGRYRKLAVLSKEDQTHRSSREALPLPPPPPCPVTTSSPTPARPSTPPAQRSLSQEDLSLYVKTSTRASRGSAEVKRRSTSDYDLAKTGVPMEVLQRMIMNSGALGINDTLKDENPVIPLRDTPSSTPNRTPYLTPAHSSQNLSSSSFLLKHVCADTLERIDKSCRAAKMLAFIIRCHDYRSGSDANLLTTAKEVARVVETTEDLGLPEPMREEIILRVMSQDTSRDLFDDALHFVACEVARIQKPIPKKKSLVRVTGSRNLKNEPEVPDFPEHSGFVTNINIPKNMSFDGRSMNSSAMSGAMEMEICDSEGKLVNRMEDLLMYPNHSDIILRVARELGVEDVVKFYLEVSRFKTTLFESQEHMQAMAQDIYHRFLGYGATDAVNIDPHVAQDIKGMLDSKKVFLCIFDDAYDAAAGLAHSAKFIQKLNPVLDEALSSPKTFREALATRLKPLANIGNAFRTIETNMKLSSITGSLKKDY